MKHGENLEKQQQKVWKCYQWKEKLFEQAVALKNDKHVRQYIVC